MTAPLALFHTGQAHVSTFGPLIARLASEIPLVHHVRQDLLDAAQPRGLTPDIRRRAVRELLGLADAGAATVLCTCSTLGPAAETAADLSEVPILRVDRPMMEAALDRGHAHRRRRLPRQHHRPDPGAAGACRRRSRHSARG